jgi:hypothetical protein
MNKRRLFLFLVFLMTAPTVPVAAAQGETIVYAISPVGRAEYNDQGTTTLNGKNVLLSTFQTRVPGFNDLEKICSDPQILLPVRVERFLKFTVGQQRLIEEYDIRNNRLTITKYVGETKVKEYHFQEDGPIQNAIMLPFYLRQVKNPEIGWTFTARFPNHFQVTLVDIEDVTVPAGTFKAFHFTSEPKKFEIWISADTKRIPVKIKGFNHYSYSFSMRSYTSGSF